MSDIIQFNYKDHWQEKEINLRKSIYDSESLGFFIAGGIDRPFVNNHFTSIIVTHIVENSLAHRDNQLKLYDIILCVNDADFTNIKHKTAVKILRTAGQNVQLRIRRLSPPISEEIELNHHGKLGISLGGGIGNEYFQKDPGIFILDIDKYQNNEQLDIGDRLIQISSALNTYDLRFITHENARKCIKLACEESKNIKLYVGHTRAAKRIENKRTHLSQGQYNPFGSKDEDPVPVKPNNYPNASDRDLNIESEHGFKNDEMNNIMHNEPQADNSNVEQLIVSFDVDDYQRYENRSKIPQNPMLKSRRINRSTEFLSAEQERPNTIKYTTLLKANDSIFDCEVNTDVKNSTTPDQHGNLRVNDSHRNGFIDQKTTQKLKVNQTAIREAYEEKLRREQGKINQRAHKNADGPLRWQVN